MEHFVTFQSSLHSEAQLTIVLQICLHFETEEKICFNCWGRGQVEMKKKRIYKPHTWANQWGNQINRPCVRLIADVESMAFSYPNHTDTSGVLSVQHHHWFSIWRVAQFPQCFSSEEFFNIPWKVLHQRLYREVDILSLFI